MLGESVTLPMAVALLQPLWALPRVFLCSKREKKLFLCSEMWLRGFLDYLREGQVEILIPYVS